MRYWLLLLALGCTNKGTPLPADTATDTDSDTDTNEPDDTAEQGTDEDGDSFTIENGDCDDNDPWINPAVSEEPGDMVDNDCDGRIDEKWSGLTVALQDPTGSSLVTISSVGGEGEDELESQLNLSPFQFCTDLAYSDQVSCEAASACYDMSGDAPVLLGQFVDSDSCGMAGASWTPTWEELDASPTFIDHADRCSDGRFVPQNTCEMSGICSDSQFEDQDQCEEGGETWTSNTWEKGWVYTHGGFGEGIAIVEVSSTGTSTLITHFLSEEDPRVYGVVAHPDGYYIASRGNQLIKILRTGDVSVLVEWDAEPVILDEDGNAVTDEDGNVLFNLDYQIFSWSIARNVATGEIGIFGLYGGFATWNEVEGLNVQRSIDIETEYGQLYAYAGASRDGGGWYSMLFDGNTGEISIGRFNHQEKQWVIKAAWTDQDQSAQEFAFPQGLTVNGDSEFGDYYITADVATYSTVFRVLDRTDPPEISDLYNSLVQPNWTFYGVVSNYY